MVLFQILPRTHSCYLLTSCQLLLCQLAQRMSIKPISFLPQEESRILRVKVVSGIDLAKKDIFGARWVLCRACDLWNTMGWPGPGPCRCQHSWHSWHTALPTPALRAASPGGSSRPRPAEPSQVIAGGQTAPETKMNPNPLIFFFWRLIQAGHSCSLKPKHDKVLYCKCSNLLRRVLSVGNEW